MRKRRLRSGISSFTLKLLTAVLFATLMATLGRAQQGVTLVWDPNSEPDLAGYTLYYGASSGVYPNAIGVGNNTTGTVSGLIQGATYFFVVTAHNSSGLESDPSNEISYSVPSQSANFAPVAHAQSLTTSENTPTDIVLDGTDPQGDLLRFVVVTPPTHGTLSGTLPNLTYTPNLNFGGPDSFTFTVNNGALNSATAIVAITVTPVNAAPSVIITSPASNATFTAPANIFFGAAADDSDGSISKVQFFQGATLLATATASPYAFTWSSVPPGSYSLTAKATDNSGAVTTSSVVNVTVNPSLNVPPSISVTSPLNNSTHTAPANVTLSANASDIDGTVAKVEFFQGAVLLGTDTTAPYNFTWNNVLTGSYTLTAKATDDTGAITTSSPINITVNPPPNLPPTININSPLNNATFAAPANVAISASASDSDGTIRKVQFFQGTTLLGTATTYPYTATWPNVAPGNYILTARATDNSGAVTTSSTVAIIVGPPSNVPPAVNIVSPANGTIFTSPASITLSAIATDSDGTVSKLEFFQGTTLVGSVISSPYIFNWSAVPAGTYALTAKATDNSGAVTTSSPRTIIVNSPANVPPNVALTSPINNTTLTAPANVTITATATDSDGSISKVEFFSGTTVLATVTTTPYTFNWTGVPTGVYNLTAKVSDNSGAVSTSIPVSVTVNPALNVPPTVSLLSPLNNSIFTAPANITLSANSVDLDGTITRVEFFQGATLLGTVTSSPYNFNWLNVTPGAYSLTAKSTDNSGAVATSTAIIVIVNPPPNVGPAVSLSNPPQNAIFAAPASISVSATATDADGTIGKVEFFQGTTLLGTVTSSPYIFNWNGVPAGTYSLTARATDNFGAATLSGARNITVIPPANVPPSVSITAPANNGTSTAPANITVSAIASDSDGTITKVEFFKGTTLLGIATSSPYTFNWPNVSAGTYNLTARATDDSNATTMSTAVQFTVNAPANVPPALSLVNPANNTSLIAPASVTISAAATDTDGAITKVQFFQGTSLLGTATSSPYTFNWTSIPVGTYSLTAAATDNGGAVTISSPVIFIVNPPANLAPSVNVTSPVNNTTFTSPANITISANASDADGTISRVEFFQGASLLGVATTSPYTFNWSNASAGTYSITAKAIDNSGAATLSSAVSLTINPRANVPPTVNLTSPPNNSTLTAPGSVTVSAQATDTDGTIAKVQFFQGTTLLATLTGSPYTFSWTGVQVGSYLLTAKATDNSGAITTSPTVAFTVNPPANQPPAVNITNPLSNATFTAPATIRIAANASDSDGTISKVDFFQGTILLGTATSAPYMFDWSNVATGTYSLTAKATDNSGAISSSGTTSVTVNPAPNVPPTIIISSPVNNAIFIAPASIAMSATASDSDGAIVKVEFFQGTTLLATATSSPYTFNWTGVPIGTYSLTARATDNSGAASISPAMSVTVNPPANVAPTVSITSPINNATFIAPANISLSASASDNDGTISKVDFFQGTTLLGSAATSPYTISWPNVAAGTYSLTVRASDNSGAVTTSSAVAISVSSPPNVAPAVNILSPANNTIFTAPASITISAMANDSDGTINKVEFFQGSSLLGIATTNPYTFNWLNVPTGIYSLTAKATDNSGAITISSSVNITVKAPANSPPTVNITSPVDNATFITGAGITILANASDNDGTIKKVDFFEGTTLLATVATAPYIFTWNGVAIGTYSLRAKATDNSGAVTTSAAVNVIVNPAANLAPTINITTPVQNALFNAPADVTITADAFDLDGTIRKVEFFSGTTLLATVTSSPYTFTWDQVAIGAYDLTARATDNSGGVTVSSVVTISVSPPANVPPTVSMTSPVNNGNLVAPADMIVAANAWDSDGTVIKVEFFQGTTLLGAVTNSPYTFAWNNVPIASYTLTARATDNSGGISISSPTTINVNAQANVPPDVIITNPTNNATYTAPASITISADAFDADGAISKVQFFLGPTLLGTATSSPYAFTWSSVPPGTYTLTARATDNANALTKSAAVTVTVNDPSAATPALTTQLTQDASGNAVLHLHVDGVFGMISYLQFSSNLVDWTGVFTGQAGQPLDYYDSQVDSRAGFFYRTVFTDASLTPPGSSNNRFEVNAIGYIKLLIQPGFALIANPFNAPTNTVGALLPVVPEGTTLYKLSDGSYSINTFEFGGWTNPDQTLKPGEGAFLRCLGNTPLALTFLGQITQGSLVNSLPAGFSIVSSQVPQAGALDTDLGFPVDDGDAVYLYDNVAGDFTAHTYEFGEWNTPPILSPGQAFMVRKIRSEDWIRSFYFETTIVAK